jgi:benzoyl-CoA 2,3-dioxygenase component B
MFTHFTDRDGKFQLNALAESGFAPLARTTQFMLTEEAYHMFVGESGVSRVIQRTCEVMNQLKTDDPAKVRAAGAIDLPTIQRYLNFHYSVTIDLFGADQSSNAAIFYSSGLKGRFKETKRNDDHVLKDASYKVLDASSGAGLVELREREVPMLNALNEVLRDDFIRDSEAGIGRWNRVIEKSDLPDRLTLPHKAFNRRIGSLAGIHVSPDGRAIAEGEWSSRVRDWMPDDGDRAFVASLMTRVAEPGKYAGWIAPPRVPVNEQPMDFEYVRFDS